MLCRLHLSVPHSPLRSRVLWPSAGSLFDELEREMDSLWERLSSNWPSATRSSSSSTTAAAATSRETVRHTSLPQSAGAFAVTQDMAGFDPQEMVVKLIGEKLVLTGEKASQAASGPFRYELFRREWDVPDGVDRERLSCSISGDGELRIEAPALTSEMATRTVPIEVSRAGAGARSGSTGDSRAKA